MEERLSKQDEKLEGKGELLYLKDKFKRRKQKFLARVRKECNECRFRKEWIKEKRSIRRRMDALRAEWQK